VLEGLKPDRKISVQPELNSNKLLQKGNNYSGFLFKPAIFFSNIIGKYPDAKIHVIIIIKVLPQSVKLSVIITNYPLHADFYHACSRLSYLLSNFAAFLGIPP
jgi:hypothetical protein